MKTKLRTAAIFTCLMALGDVAPVWCRTAGDDARVVLARTVEALGGEAAFAAIRTYEIRVQRNIRSSADGVKYVTLGEKFREPGAVRKEAEIRPAGRGPYVTRSLQVFDGTNGWSDENEKQEMVQVRGGPLRRTRLTTFPRFTTLRNAARGGVEATLLGRETLAGREVQRVRIQVPGGTIEYLIDVQSRLPSRADVFLEGMTQIVSLDDYRATGGVTIPFRIVTDTRGPSEDEYVEDRITEVRLNPVLPEGSFASPLAR